MWMIILLLIILIGFTGNIVSLLRAQKHASQRIIELLEKQSRKSSVSAVLPIIVIIIPADFLKYDLMPFLVRMKTF